MARNTKAQALVTRDTIIEVAERLIETNGLSRTTLQDVAEAAGVTRGAIYWHFQNKSALFDSIMERAFVPFENALLLLNSQAIEPPLVRLREHAIYIFKCMSSDERLRRFMGIATQKIEYTDEIDAVRERLVRARARHIATIEQCLEPTTLPQTDKLTLAIGLHVIVDGLIQNWMLDPSAFNLVEVGQVTVNTYLRGIAPSVRARNII